MKSNSPSYNLSLIDKKLIRLLQEDCTRGKETIAAVLGVSTATVRRRIKKLNEAGIVQLVARVDPNKIGNPLTTIIGFDIAHDKLVNAVKSLASKPEIAWISTTTGGFDIMAIARFESTEDLSEFMQR